MKMIQAEYIWMDGAEPTQQLRSKTRILQKDELCPLWGFDGSSTNQSDGSNSDLILKPMRVVPDPIRGKDDLLVLCEVFESEDQPHSSNTRAVLRDTMSKVMDTDPWIGYEQEYTLFRGALPLAWPEGQISPPPQGPYYCGVGSDQVFGRALIEAHTKACMDAKLMIYGVNAEVMPGQWEFQIGYRGVKGESADPLCVADHLWLARWLLYRLGEDFGIHATLNNKPVKGDWNGAGCHTNFSNKFTRDHTSGMKAIMGAIDRLSKNHDNHIQAYGEGLSDRLTGEHETCSIHDFRCGVSDRGASIRIPLSVSQAGYGYFEDRRPGANSDPYVVAAMLLHTIGDLSEYL